jgi:hypothetical protein
MHYVCIENNVIISVLNYAPSVPSSVTVVEISDTAHQQIVSETHYFDVTTKTVKPVSPDIAVKKDLDLRNGQEREFLNSTDWKILRHLRQKALNITTSLTDAQYVALETQREAAAARIV